MSCPGTTTSNNSRSIRVRSSSSTRAKVGPSRTADRSTVNSPSTASVIFSTSGRMQAPANLAALPTYCTMKATANFCRIPRYNGGYKWPSLEELHRKLFGRPHTASHDARADVVACAKCFFELRRLGVAQISFRASSQA